MVKSSRFALNASMTVSKPLMKTTGVCDSQKVNTFPYFCLSRNRRRYPWPGFANTERD